MPLGDFTHIRSCETPEGTIVNALVNVLREVFNASEEAIQEAYTRECLEDLRAERNRLIAETDWWANSDRTMTQEQIDYRQALRDITNTYTSLDDVVWPEKPE